MYARIIKGQLNAGQADGFAKRRQAFVAPRLRGMAGFRRAYALVDRTSNAVAGISLWDGPSDRAALDRLPEEFRPTVCDLVSGTPTTEQYEVLAEIAPQ